jgi:transposase
MRKIREILRLRWEKKLSQRAVGRSVRSSPATVSDTVNRAKLAGLSWPLPEALDDVRLEALLYPPPAPSVQPRAVPDWDQIHRELRRKGVTLQLLWQEYKEAHPDDGYQYSQFCELYKRFKGQLDVVLRQPYRAGEKGLVDFSGDGIPIVDPRTGEVTQAELFIAVLGASNLTYAEAFESQQLRCWIDGHMHAYEYWDGVPEITVPDNTKTGVLRPCWYDPDLNPTYREMAKHYGSAIIPARPRKPRDKAKAENAVLVAQRWILAALRNHTFFSIEQANEAIWAKLEQLNDRPFQKIEGCRRSLYESLDRPALQPLPPQRYVFAEWLSPRISIDYHVDVKGHYYSVPYTLAQKRDRQGRRHKVEVRLTATTVEAFYRGNRVASHERSYVKGGYTTKPEHMPPSHRRYLEWSPSRILNWAATVGVATSTLCEKIMESKRHPEQGYRACLGVMRLSKAYGTERMEPACERALTIGALSYRSVESILKRNLDRQPLDRSPSAKTVEHDNVRGPDYYH